MLIPSHPFYTGLIPADEVADQPASLPFDLRVDPRHALPRLVLTDAVRDALDHAYAVGSMASTPLGESTLASIRMNEFIGQLAKVFGDLRGKSLLEVGCGNGELLNQLRLRGAVVTGLEIGPQAGIVEERYGIRVIREPLTVGSLNEQFDGIVSYGCLEHIEDLDGFCAASRSCLRDGGLFLHSVPNAALGFERVSLDHLLHEHINYFTPANAIALLLAQGFSSPGAVPTSAGNELMLWGEWRGASVAEAPAEHAAAESDRLDAYAKKLENKVALTLAALRVFRDRGESVAFYAGGFEYGFHLADPSIRYVDGDTYKHGKRWLPCLPAIEGPSALADRPVDHVVVCRPHYFGPIREALERLGVDPQRLISIDELPMKARI